MPVRRISFASTRVITHVSEPPRGLSHPTYYQSLPHNVVKFTTEVQASIPTGPASWPRPVVHSPEPGPIVHNPRPGPVIRHPVPGPVVHNPATGGSSKPKDRKDDKRGK